MPRSPRYFPDASVALFKRLNMILPMAPMVDTVIMHEWISSVYTGGMTMSYLMEARLSPSQHADIASATNLIHASRHIPFLIKGQDHVVREADRNTLRQMAEHMVKAGQVIVMPANVPHSVQASRRFKMLLVVVKGA